MYGFKIEIKRYEIWTQVQNIYIERDNVEYIPILR